MEETQTTAEVDVRNIESWDADSISKWLTDLDFDEASVLTMRENGIDGYAFVRMTENDLREPPVALKKLGAIKHLYGQIEKVRPKHITRSNRKHSYNEESTSNSLTTLGADNYTFNEQKFSHNLRPERFKTFVAFVYTSMVLLFCAFVMTFVNDRVPSINEHPPLPDLFLDNVPFVEWAMVASEYICMSLMAVAALVVLTHKHRFIILRRFCSLLGTLYLLRGICMVITALPVPCKYFKCLRYENSDIYERLWRVMHIAISGGLVVNGNRICGDYMFSGHTVIITLLNLFIDEYSSKNILIIKTLGWVLNMFGIFFVMAGHEHYSIDVFIAFYLTTRLFLYYHTLADNHHRLRYDERKVRYWFPLFSYFEANVTGAVPYKFEFPFDIPNMIASGWGEQDESRKTD